MAKDILFLNLINGCNLACDYCLVRKDREEMSLKTMLTSLDYFLDANKGLLHIDFFSCESMLRFDLIKEAVEYCKPRANKDQLLSFSIITNGTLFDDKKLDFIEKHPEVCLTISLDGTEESHNCHRKYKDGRGTFKDTIKYIDRLVDMNTVFSLVVSSETAGRLMENIAFLNSLGCKKLILQFAVTQQGWTKNGVDTASDQLRRLAHFYFDNMRPNGGMDIFLIDFMVKTLERRREIDTPSDFERIVCSTLRRERAISVSPSGKVYPCLGLSSLADDNFCIGRVDDTVRLGGEECFYRKILPGFTENYSNGICRSCAVRDFCYLRGCPVVR
ncbi:MAG: radical SAM protein, partial [Candidatus Omnitrophica bacterium]|nr:radical SAM protein [Candidatus Omnitrophota bacterium]